MTNQKDLLNVDWSVIPAPEDDGAAAHLTGATFHRSRCRRRTEAPSISPR